MSVINASVPTAELNPKFGDLRMTRFYEADVVKNTTALCGTLFVVPQLPLFARSAHFISSSASALSQQTDRMENDCVLFSFSSRTCIGAR